MSNNECPLNKSARNNVYMNTAMAEREVLKYIGNRRNLYTLVFEYENAIFRGSLTIISENGMLVKILKKACTNDNCGHN